MKCIPVGPLLVLGTICSALNAQNVGAFAATGDMTAARAEHTATLLFDGKVLLTGGYGAGQAILASAELYDPATGTFTATGDMSTPRRIHSATLLADGRVLIAGGFARDAATGLLASAELYDPSTGTFAPTGSMIAARAFHTATLLADGRVLFTGGAALSNGIAGAELYDPSTGMFTATGAYVGVGECDFCAPATLLADGRVLFLWQQPAQLYDPVSGSFQTTGGTRYSDHSATTLLMNGKVLLTGGENDFGRSASAEVYDPASGFFNSIGDMTIRRVWQTSTLMPDGSALITGGETDSCSVNICMYSGSVVSAELLDPSAGAFVAAGQMIGSRETHTATLLNDGRVLLAGGSSSGGIGLFYGSLKTAELYSAPQLTAAAKLFSLSGDGRGQGAILHGGTSRLASADDPATAGEALEIYGAGLADGGAIPPQVFIGGRAAQVLFFGNAPGFVGLNQINVRVPAGIPAGSSVPVRLLYLDRPSNAVTIGVK